MIDLLVRLVAIATFFFIVLYRGESTLRAHKGLDKFLGRVEHHYVSAVSRISTACGAGNFELFIMIYGYLTVFLLAAMILASLTGTLPYFSPAFQYMFVASAFFSISIRWCIFHRDVMYSCCVFYIFLVIAPVLSAAVDVIFEVDSLYVIRENLGMFPGLGFGIFDVRGLSSLGLGAYISALFAVGLVFAYIAMWVLAIPAALVSIFPLFAVGVVARVIGGYPPKLQLQVSAILIVGLVSTYGFARILL